MKHYSKEFKDTCREMYLQGMPAQKVSKKMSCSKSAVERWIKESRINRTKSEAAFLRGYSEEFKDKCMEMYSAEMSSSQIAKKMSCSPAAVCRWAEKRGIKRTLSEAVKISKYSKEFRDKCKEIYLAGLTTAEISRKMGCAASTILVWNKEAGINRTKNKIAKPRGYSREFKSKCVEMFLMGSTTIEVAKKMKCNNSEIMQWLGERGLNKTKSKIIKSTDKNRKCKYSEGFKDECRGMYLTGLTTTEIAKRMGCSNRSVSEWNIEAGINRSLSEAMRLEGRIPPSQKGRKRSAETRAKISGSNNHFWKGGVALLNKRLRMSQKMIDWRNEVFKRDGYICHFCECRGRNSNGEPINAHHALITIQYMMENFETLEDCFDYKPFWELNNGVTLCRDCHKKVHSGKLILEINVRAQSQ